VTLNIPHDLFHALVTEKKTCRLYQGSRIQDYVKRFTDNYHLFENLSYL
jgi:hypothetical protein